VESIEPGGNPGVSGRANPDTCSRKEAPVRRTILSSVLTILMFAVIAMPAATTKSLV